MAKHTMTSAAAKRILLSTGTDSRLSDYVKALEEEDFYPGERYLDYLIGQLIREDNYAVAAHLGMLCAQHYGWLRRDVREFNRHLSIVMDYDSMFWKDV
jgi:hypothetical protein